MFRLNEISDYSIDDLIELAVDNDIRLNARMTKEEMLAEIAPKPELELLEYQKRHVDRMISILNIPKSKRVDAVGIALDSSKMGTGKTYTALGIAQKLGYKIFVVCPIAVLENWYNLASTYQVEILGITNYEKLRADKVKNGNVSYYPMKNGFILSSKKCPYIVKTTNGTEKKKVGYEWKLPENTLIIFDEGHKTKNLGTQNSKLIMGARDFIKTKKTCKMIVLTGTPIEKSSNLRSLLYVLGYTSDTGFQTMHSFRLAHGAMNDKDVHNLLYVNPDYRRASRMTEQERDEELKSPYTNDIKAESFSVDVDIATQIQRENETIGVLLEETKSNPKRSVHILAQITRARRRIELIKSSIIADLAHSAYNDGYSIAIFVNYLPSIDALQSLLKYPFSVIRGGQSASSRSTSIRRFNSGQVRIIISTISSGGTGISLHDTKGDAPRYSIISPTYSMTELQQVLGRVHRTGSKSNTIQRIVYVKPPSFISLPLNPSLPPSSPPSSPDSYPDTSPNAPSVSSSPQLELFIEEKMAHSLNKKLTYINSVISGEQGDLLFDFSSPTQTSTISSAPSFPSYP